MSTGWKLTLYLALMLSVLAYKAYPSYRCAVLHDCSMVPY